MRKPATLLDSDDHTDAALMSVDRTEGGEGRIALIREAWESYTLIIAGQTVELAPEVAEQLALAIARDLQYCGGRTSGRALDAAVKTEGEANLERVLRGCSTVAISRANGTYHG